jgi:hypothetical protein
VPLKHKHLKLDQEKIDFAKRYFGVSSDQEAIDRALGLLVEEQRILQTLRSLRGGLKDAVDRLRAAFPTTRQISPSPRAFDRAGRLFPLLYGRASGDRLRRLNDLLIGLTAWEIGAAVVTQNVDDFARIATVVQELAVTAPC